MWIGLHLTTEFTLIEFLTARILSYGTESAPELQEQEDEKK